MPQELLNAPSVESIIADPAFNKAYDALEKANEQPVVPEKAVDPIAAAESRLANTQSGTEADLATGGGVKDDASAQLPATGEGEEPAAGGLNQTGGEVPETWIDDEAKELARSYGITEDRLRKFSSREDFENAASFYDEQLLAGRRSNLPNPQAKVDPITGQPVGQQTQQQAPEPAKTPDTAVQQNQQNQQNQQKPSAPAKPERFDIEAMRKEGYDDHSLKLFEQVNLERDRNDLLEQRLAKVEPFVEATRQQQEQVERANHQRVLYQFNSNTDGLTGQEQRFGKSIGEDGRYMPVTAEQKANRDRLFATANQMAVNINQQGRQLPPMDVLLKRAMSYEFSTEMLAEQKQQLKTNIQQQSAKRRSVGASKPVSAPAIKPGMSQNDKVSAIANHPDLIRAFNQMEAETGAR